MTEKNELPIYTDAQTRVIEGRGDAVDWFITENEPSGIVENPKFRRELMNLVELVRNDTTAVCAREWATKFRRERETHQQEVDSLRWALRKVEDGDGNSGNSLVSAVKWILIAVVTCFCISAAFDFFGR